MSYGRFTLRRLSNISSNISKNLESFELRVNYSNLPLCGEKFKGEWE
jgi:hypothetical protein